MDTRLGYTEHPTNGPRFTSGQKISYYTSHILIQFIPTAVLAQTVNSLYAFLPFLASDGMLARSKRRKGKILIMPVLHSTLRSGKPYTYTILAISFISSPTATDVRSFGVCTKGVNIAVISFFICTLINV